jgi:3-isopropylmalate/(R)-2-methylmalate dehydratase small subunit
MTPFTVHSGLVATLDRSNVDTDQIIPKQFLKRIERTGFGQFLFFDWRFDAAHQLRSDFELNQPQFAGASILLSRRNFGSGSSREHAVWALADYGFRCVIAESFADIFHNNCLKNGVLPIQLSPAEIDQLFTNVAEHPGYTLTVDLPAQTVRDDRGFSASFQIDPSRKYSLVHGLDDIGLTLQSLDKIESFESRRGYAPVPR